MHIQDVVREEILVWGEGTDIKQVSTHTQIQVVKGKLLGQGPPHLCLWMVIESCSNHSLSARTY